MHFFWMKKGSEFVCISLHSSFVKFTCYNCMVNKYDLSTFSDISTFVLFQGSCLQAKTGQHKPN